MPFDVRARGVSATGVMAHEPIEIVIRAGYPWKSPTVYFRQDFPRDFPHLQPSLPEALPRPCLVEGSQDEYFAHFGLIEAGIMGLLDQLSTWLAKAGALPLINPSGPRALKRTTQSRTICRVTLPSRAASEREPPS
ncbi:hypothetical protein [Sinorhizobium meliloti]